MPDEPAPQGAFPATRWSAIVAARSADGAERRRGLERVAAAYWKPVYKLLRTRWNKSHEDARELTQEFFARVVEKDTLSGFDPAKGRLRTYVRTLVDAMVMNEARDARREKRGGGAEVLSLDFELAEGELLRTGIASPENPDAYFEREWVRSLFALALERLRAECAARGKTVHVRLFELYDVEDSEPRPTYADLAARFDIAVTDVTNHLAYARRELRRITLETLREMTVSEEEFRSEARALLGFTPDRD